MLKSIDSMLFYAQVNYTDINANLGDEITPAQAANEPKVQWPVTPGGYYTLCMSGIHKIEILILKIDNDSHFNRM